MKTRILTVLIISLMTAALLSAEAPVPGRMSPVTFEASAETGALKVLTHTLRFRDESSNTDFNYVTQGGQELLFPYERYEVEIGVFNRHRLSFLYQPLTLETVTKVGANTGGTLTVDDVSFPVGSSVKLTYGFDFWRLSYLYRIIDSPRLTAGLGLSLQLRNASIVFEGLDPVAGTTPFVVSQNLGPVPILKGEVAWAPVRFMRLALEVDGFFASSAFFNGADFEFTGYIWDGALRAEFAGPAGITPYLTLRALGGGAVGADGYPREYWTQAVATSTANHLSTGALAIGVKVR